MRPAMKQLAVLFLMAALGGVAAQAGDRLPRVLDPLGILPTPRQVVRTLDHVVRTLPPVVVETRGYPVYDDDCDYPAYPVYPVRGYYPRPRRVYFAPPPFDRPRPYGYEGRGYRRGHDDWRGQR